MKGLALTILTAAVWLQVAVVCPLLDPDVQLPWQNTDRGGLPTAGWSRQKQDTALQNTKPNAQYHVRLKQCFNNPGLRRKIVLFICYQHGFLRVKLPLGLCMPPLWWGRVEPVQEAKWHTSTHNLDSGANIFKGWTEKRTMHQNTALVKSIKLLLLLICEEQRRWFRLLLRRCDWCLWRCFVQVLPGQEPKKDHCSLWGPEGGSWGQECLDSEQLKKCPFDLSSDGPQPLPRGKTEWDKILKKKLNK